MNCQGSLNTWKDICVFSRKEIHGFMHAEEYQCWMTARL
jgi:hypothetical protein